MIAEGLAVSVIAVDDYYEGHGVYFHFRSFIVYYFFAKVLLFSGIKNNST